MLNKSSLTQIVLDKLYQIGELTLEGLLPNNRTEARIWRKALGLHDKYEFSPRTFSVILSRLKSQGLVDKNGNNRKSIWSITKKGENSILNIDIIKSSLPKEDGIARLVMFDIPENERNKRNLVRLELVACGFKQLQRSVWIGYRPLPEKFIKSLDDLKLRNKVQIVSINKIGTLETV